jgi:hypothetical protein
VLKRKRVNPKDVFDELAEVAADFIGEISR